MGDQEDCPASLEAEKREALSVFRELWSMGNPALHRMYSSWEELERHIEVESEAVAREKYAVKPCPYCGAKQRIVKPLDGVFPYLNCENCKRPFFVESNLKVRRLTDEEKANIPGVWVQVVENLAKKKVAVVLGLE